MAGMGHARTPGARFREQRERAGFRHPIDLARCMLKKIRRHPDAPLARKFQGPNAETELVAFIIEYENRDGLSKNPQLFPEFVRTAAACFVGGNPSNIDYVTVLLRLGIDAGDVDPNDDPNAGGWEEGD